MDSKRISIQQVKIYRHALNNDAWHTAKELAAGAGVGLRVARLHAMKLEQIGVFERMRVFPDFRYRCIKPLHKSARAYAAKLGEAAQVFGLT